MDGIRAPTQKRGQDALDKLLTAGAELLAERGVEGFTLTEVSKRAGVSYGAMYWRIESKDALLNAIHERFIEQVNIDLAHYADPERWVGLSVDELIEKAIREDAAVFEHDPALLRALTLQATIDPRIAARAGESLRAGNEAFVGRVAPQLREAGHPDPERTASYLFTTVTLAMSARITWPEFHYVPELAWDRFVDDLCSMAVAHIRTQLPD